MPHCIENFKSIKRMLILKVRFCVARKRHISIRYIERSGSAIFLVTGQKYTGLWRWMSTVTRASRRQTKDLCDHCKIKIGNFHVIWFGKDMLWIERYFGSFFEHRTKPLIWPSQTSGMEGGTEIRALSKMHADQMWSDCSLGTTFYVRTGQQASLAVPKRAKPIISITKFTSRHPALMVLATACRWATAYHPSSRQ